MRHFAGLLCLVALSGFAAEPGRPAPLTRAHAHNDYEHKRPLLDALDQGFCSVEADVYLVAGKLLVAHDLKDVKPERTLQALYLEPLRERVRKNGGHVYREVPTFTLLVDIKSDATNTYIALREALKGYAQILTRFHPAQTEANAITVILSGNRAGGLMQSARERLAAYDGRLEDLDSGASPHFMPLISDNWTKYFKWRGVGPMPDEEKQKLKGIVDNTHRQGKRLRLWGTPDSPAVWSELLSAGVDLVNIDDLKGFQKYYQSGPGGRGK